MVIAQHITALHSFALHYMTLHLHIKYINLMVFLSVLSCTDSYKQVFFGGDKEIN